MTRVRNTDEPAPCSWMFHRRHSRQRPEQDPGGWMLTIHRLQLARSIAALATSLVCLSVASSKIPAKRPGTQATVGHVIGNIDGIGYDGDQAYVSGWACQQGQKKSVAVGIFVDR